MLALHGVLLFEICSNVMMLFLFVAGIPVLANSDDIPVHSTPIKVSIIIIYLQDNFCHARR